MSAADREEPGLDPNDPFERLLEYIQRNRGFDFTGYKRSSLRRRVGKRMQDLGIEGYENYMDHLEASAGEFPHLFATILINVSSFFRDAAVWDHIAKQLIPELLAGKPDHAPIRVWSAGCATGEEPYSIAILLADALGLRAYAERVKIFATDLDDDALDQARLGAYAPKQVEELPADVVERYFQPVAGKLSLGKDLRRGVIFGRNDLVRDAPISKLDLLLCRNTLMYLNAETQAGVIRRLHLALGHGGILVLGKSEMLLSFDEGFTAENQTLRVFRKVPLIRARNGNPVLVSPRTGPSAGLIPDAVMEAFRVSPIAQLVVNTDGTVVLGNEPLRKLFGFSEHDVGRPLQDLEISYRPAELRSLIDDAHACGEPITVEPVTYKTRDGSEHALEIEVTALGDGGDHGGTSIAFLDVTRYNRITSELETSKRELETAYEELQSTVEELETTNEELQSTNEELETTNEELQSTNEELETMNEELQSSNEELEAMNDELRLRTHELNRVNILVDSMLTSLGVGVVVVDTELRVQIWNERSKEMWGLSAADVRDQHFLNLDIGLPVQQLRDPLRACVSGASAGEETRIEARDRRGTDIVCRIRVVPLAGSNSGIAGAILLVESA